jgi:hypothetical protein
MGRRWASVGLTAVTALIVWIAANTIIRSVGPVELQEMCAQALSKGDAAAIRALSIEAEGPRIWETLRSAQIDKAEKLVTRGAGWSVSPLGPATGYLDLTAENSAGLSAPFRLELVRGGIFCPGEWRIRAVRYDEAGKK